MLIHLCQLWGDDQQHVIKVFLTREETEDFLLDKEAEGVLRLWGNVAVFVADSKLTPAQFLRSRRVTELIDALSKGWQRPGYGNEYVKSLYDLDPEKWQPLMSYSDPSPNTLLSDELPQDHIEPVGPNWHIRAKVRDWRESADAERYQQRADIATARLALPCNDELRLQRAIASLAAQLAQPETAEAPIPAPTAEDQLRELQFELDGKALPLRSVEQQLRYL